MCAKLVFAPGLGCMSIIRASDNQRTKMDRNDRSPLDKSGFVKMYIALCNGQRCRFIPSLALNQCMNKLFCTLGMLLICSLSQHVSGQSIFKRYLDHILQDTSDQAKPKFIFYPTIAYAPETSVELGISTLLVYRAKRDTNNRLSEIASFSFLTLQRQYGGFIDHALYTDKNQFFFLGLLKYQNFPLSYYGIGPNTTEDVKATISATEFRFRERLLYKLAPSLYTGPEVDFELMRNVRFDAEDTEPFQYPRGKDGFTDVSLGWGLVYDNRHNVLNVRDGLFMELAWLSSQRTWGSTFSFNSWFSDFRYYHPVGKQNVLAFHLYGQFSGGYVPFNQLALMGGERLMRGYYLGRYRDNHLMAAQTEFRLLPLPFSERWGAAVFAGIGEVAPTVSSFGFDRLQWSAGLGPRFLLFPEKDVFTRFDVAFTREGMGFYFFIGEAF